MLAQQEDVVSMKGKRSKRLRPPSEELHGGGATSDVVSGGSGCYDDLSTRGVDEEKEEDEDMAKCLILLAKGQNSPAVVAAASTAAPEVVNRRCKTCNRSFSSFRALGGHRAGHNRNRPTNKPLSALGESTILSLRVPTGKPVRVHGCSTCGAEFSSGQALGGHMRRHRAAAVVGGSPDRGKMPRAILSLDLNLPAPEDDDDQRENNKFAFAVPQEQIIVFSATSSLVDCHF